jgi:hypothetical protein
MKRETNAHKYVSRNEWSLSLIARLPATRNALTMKYFTYNCHSTSTMCVPTY